ncbi:MAG TPA: response regulator [Verrucomicrobiae bacterium]
MIRNIKPSSLVAGLRNLLAPAKIKWPLIYFIAGFCCLQSHGFTNGFETLPPKVGSIQWQNLQDLAKRRQELYRKHVPVPGAMAANVPRVDGADYASFSEPKPVASSTPPPATWGKFPKILFFTAVFVFAGLILLRKFAPVVWSELNARFNPWALEPAADRMFPAVVRAEEESFDKFLATFRIGPASSHAEAVEKNNPVSEFYARAADLIETQRTLLQDIHREASDSTRHKKLTSLLSKMSALKGEAGFPEALPLWQVASALEGLLKQLTAKTGNVTPSTLRSVAGGLDLLDDLCAPGLKPDLLTGRALKFLVVDDDLISRQAISLALKKAFGQPDLAVDGEAALAQANRQAYDVIFLDVQFPGMDGFEICTKIRQTDFNRATPVIFVTSQSDFDARAKSTLSGGNDLMSKPFLTFEITVKALTLAWQDKLPKRVQKSFPKRERSAENLLTTLNDTANSANSFITRPSAAISPEAPDELTEAFLRRASTHLDALRELCQKILKAPDEAARQNLLADAFLRVNSLVSRNGSEVTHPAYQMSAALEGLLKKLLENPKNSTPSALATVAAAMDLIQDLCQPGLKELAANPPINLLVVDDDLVARRAIVGALQTTFSRPQSAENGEDALAAAMEKTFDVIFLDVVMPGMDGFEVSAKIHETIKNRVTPVVFVTGQNEFQIRARMNGNNGDALLGKPFLTSELNVKALTFVLRGRLEQFKMAEK